MRRFLFSILCSLFIISSAQAFSGFYIAKQGEKPLHRSSQIVIVRHENKTVLTMRGDYQGGAKEFAIVVPVPNSLRKDQIRILEPALLDHLDDYSSPRLVEYFDEDPCVSSTALTQSQVNVDRVKKQITEVKVEAKDTLGEYEILILTPQESHHFEHWSKENGYSVPKGVSSVLENYLKQGMKFLVVKVKLKEKNKAGFAYLRPLQISFESSIFTLPISLSALNAKGPQDFSLYLLTQKGRVDSTHYRTILLSSDIPLPFYIKSSLPEFYQAMLSEQMRKEGERTLFLEYAGEIGKCRGCSERLSYEELQALGVSWPYSRGLFLTRLHARYDRTRFLEDLSFQETENRQNFQVKYILRHPWIGKEVCSDSVKYREAISQRQEQEAKNLADLTGWSLKSIKKVMKEGFPYKKKWYQYIWGDQD